MLYSVKKQVKMPYSMLKPALNMLFIKEETSANRNTLLSTDADVFLLMYAFYRFTLHAALRAVGRLVLEAIPTREATAAAQFKIIALAAKIH